MKNLYILTSATVSYNNYLPFLFKSLSNIKLSDIWNLNLIVMSDKEPDFSIVPENINKKIYYHIVHYPYAFNIYLYPNIIYDFIIENKLSNNDYILYIDADTIFRNGDYYRKFENDLLSNKMIFSISPWFITSQYNYENNICKENGYLEVYIENMINTDFIQTSVFAGQINIFKEFFKNEYEKMQTKLIKNWINKKMLPMNDQSLINYIVAKNRENYIKDNYIFNLYQDINLNDVYNSFKNSVSCWKSFKIDNYPNIFLIQKFNTYIKEQERLSI